MIGIRSFVMAGLAFAAVLTPALAQSDRQAAARGKGLITIFDNFAHKYPKGLYLDLSGANVRGTEGAQLAWWGEPFTPSANHTVTDVEVAASSYSGTNAVELSLYNDSGGVPGKALKTWTLKNLPASGQCCVISAGTDAKGIPVEAGKQYWVVLSTNRKEASTWVIWNAEAADQVDSSPDATYDVVYGWIASTVTPQLAFAVRGTN